MTLFDFFAGPDGRNFFRRQAWFLALAAIALFAVFSVTDLDRALVRPFYDAALGNFPLKKSWLLEDVLHRGARDVSVLCALVVIAASIATWIVPRRFPRLTKWRSALSFVAVALVLAPTVVGTLKHFSTHACPWDVAEFGGEAPYRKLLSANPAPFAAEGCIPAAHPVSGFSWFALTLALYPYARSRARRWWWVAFALGLGLGMVQMLRGAHFLSHVLWSAWVVWATQLVALWFATKLVTSRRGRDFSD